MQTLEAAKAGRDTTESSRPLCVDLDGTLAKSDTLWDSLMVLARNKPLLLLKLPGLIIQGKAPFKALVVGEAGLEVMHLPYNRQVQEYLKSEFLKGRKIYLATGADQAVARRVAAHLGIFEDVLASDGHTNLTGVSKLERLKARFGAGGYDYIGNAAADLPLLQLAGAAMVANPDLSLMLGLRRRRLPISRSFDDHLPKWKAIIAAARVHQWAKNTLVFLPLLLAHSFHTRGIVDTLFAFLCFSFCASATYVVNDLLDLEADRAHPHKRFRPFAAGELSVASGGVMVVVLLLLTLIGLTQLPRLFTFWIVFYLVVTNLYSFVLKRIALVDVFVLSGLYTLRMIAGGSATDTPISHWLAGLSIFLFLSLAMVKRYSELQNLRARGAIPANGRGYLLVDMDQLRNFGTSSAYSAVVIFSVYITGRDAAALYRHPFWMWLIAPLMLLWLNRIWLLASRGEMNEDPVVFAVTDRMSILIGIAVLLVALLAI